MDKVLFSSRIVLYYPPDLPEDKIKLLLSKEEKSLKQVEEIFKIQYPDKPRIFIRIAPFNMSWTDSEGIHYSAPSSEFQKLTEEKYDTYLGRLHEWSHFLALNLLCQERHIKPPSFFLIEGLATAVDALINAKYRTNLHLTAKGLLKLGKLKQVTEISNRDFLTLTINEAGSFTSFLLEYFGIEKLKEVYRYINDEEKFNNHFERIYGKSISFFEEKWKAFLNSFLQDENQRAQYVAYASLGLDQMHPFVLECEKFWISQGFRDLPDKILKKEEAFYEAFFNLSQTSELEYAYKTFCRAIDDFRVYLEKRQKSIKAFSEAKLLITQHKCYDSIQDLLKYSLSLALDIEDLEVVTKVSHYIDIIKLLRKVREAHGYNEKRKLLKEAEKKIMLYKER